MLTFAMNNNKLEVIMGKHHIMDPPFPHHVPYFCITLTQTYVYIFIPLNLHASGLSLA